MENDIYYLVNLKKRYKFILYKTILTKQFCGKLIKGGISTIFELKTQKVL